MVIGGGAAGMSAASAARRVAPELDVVVCEAGGFAAYGMCGIPYFLGGTVPRAENLLAYPPSEFRDHRGIDLRLRTAVSAIDASAHQVHLAGETSSGPLGYDALVVAAGASPVRPPVPGLDGPRVFTIRSLEDAIGLRRLLEEGTVRRAIVVGAGYIGLETAEALVCAGIEVEVIEALPRVLGNVDEPIAGLARAELERHVRLVHAPDGRLLGGQLAGREGAAKRIDVLATALHAGLTVADLAGLDLSYAPPFAPVYDPVLAAAIKAAQPAPVVNGRPAAVSIPGGPA